MLRKRFVLPGRALLGAVVDLMGPYLYTRTCTAIDICSLGAFQHRVQKAQARRKPTDGTPTRDNKEQKSRTDTLGLRAESKRNGGHR